MKQTKKPIGHDSFTKIALIVSMYAGAALVTVSGALFLVYSFARNIHIGTASLSIPGFVVALLMLFFGSRSFLSVRKFSQAVLKNPLRLSMGIFKKPSHKKQVGIRHAARRIYLV